MKYLLLILLCAVTSNSFAQAQDKSEILAVLREQSEAWNKGDLNAFMKGYWKNDTLMFIGKNGITYGYNNTLENYKKSYSDTTKMGQLFFDILQIKRLTDAYYFVIGKWTLKRTIGNLSGHYSLVFRKIDGKWYIIADHSS